MKSRPLTRSTRVPEQQCFNCGHKLDAATSTKGKVPAPGAVSICIECRNISVFTNDMTLRAPSRSEKAAFLADPYIQRVLRTMQRAERERN